MASGLLIRHEKNHVLKFLIAIHSEKFKEFIPNLEITFMIEGNYFVQRLTSRIGESSIYHLHKQA